jgi:aspartate 1-decarboxylase
MELANIVPYEKVAVLNINTGARFETYAIEGNSHSGVICLNGAAARLVQRNDLVIILTYVEVEDDPDILDNWHPIVVKVDEKNIPKI